MKDLTPVFFPKSTRYARPNEGVPTMALPKLKPEFDIDAYMAWEEDQPERHEYLGGEAFAMSGGTDAHYTILGNAYAELRAALSGKPCRAFISGMKLRVDRADAVFYPDVFVTCD
ncbi:MAG TPA: Uma2 family endonuclease, partial [Thauera aminoaromatica]|nr:Uma2 family endonuclease [Thauera aminoaromatica]